jgi:hypothetical protein
VINLYALLLLNFVRQSATSPPQTIDWAQLLLTSGVVIAIVGVVGNLALNAQKRMNDEHLANVNKANAEAATKANDLVAAAAAKRQEDANQSLATLKLAEGYSLYGGLFTQLVNSIQQQAEILDALSAKQSAQHTEASEERRRVMAGIATDVLNVGSDMQAHRQESKGWYEDVQAEIESLRTDFAAGIDKVIAQLALMPTSAAQEEANRRIIETLTTLSMKFQQLEQRITAPPITDGPDTQPITEEPKQ